MPLLHPSILEFGGKKAFAVLPYAEFIRIEEDLQDFEDLKELRTAKNKEGRVRATPLASVRKSLRI